MLGPEPTAKQDRVSVRKLDSRCLMGGSGREHAVRCRWLGAEVSAADAAEEW